MTPAATTYCQALVPNGPIAHVTPNVVIGHRRKSDPEMVYVNHV